MLGLKAAQRSLELCRNLGREKEEVALVINRHGAKQCLPAKEVARVLKLDPLAVLPNDSPVLMAAANAGSPPVRDWPRSKWSKSVAALAKDLFSGNGGAK